MNQISLLLYWGNVFTNLGQYLIFIGLIFTAFTFALFIKYLDDRRVDMLKVKLDPKTWLFFILAVSSWTTAVFVPSADTVYAIAASELGGQALKTPLAGKAEKALESWLDTQITTAGKSSSTSS